MTLDVYIGDRRKNCNKKIDDISVSYGRTVVPLLHTIHEEFIVSLAETLIKEAGENIDEIFVVRGVSLPVEELNKCADRSREERWS